MEFASRKLLLGGVALMISQLSLAKGASTVSTVVEEARTFTWTQVARESNDDEEAVPLSHLLAQLERGYGGEGEGSRSPRVPSPAGETKPAAKRPVAHVLVVDDVPAVQELLRDYLESEGYMVEVAGNGSDALLRLSEVRSDVVLLDILMPGLSGISVLKQIRAMYPGVQVIMVTGIGEEQTGKEALALGAADYVTKPIDFSYLGWALETCLLMRPLLPECYPGGETDPRVA